MPNLTHKDTSWERDAAWYDEHLGSSGTYHETLVLPNLMRLLELEPGTSLIDIACGQGYFSRVFAAAGAEVLGMDAAPSLIESARKEGGGPRYQVGDAADLRGVPSGSFDVATVILALQNIEPASAAIGEAARVLKPGGRLMVVMNHPAFRIPKQSSWGWEGDVQYRREDRYLSELRERLQTHPGSDPDRYTYSFHRPLQFYFKAFAKAGLSVTRLEEWSSNRKSQPGPRAAAEDKARAEFPLFLCMEARKSDG